MIRCVPFILALPLLLLAYSDYDMDGVEDRFDACNATPFTDIVDATGCSIRSLESAHQFQATLLLSYAQLDPATFKAKEILNTILSLDYTYHDFGFWTSLSHYNMAEEEGMNDTYIALSYRLHPLQTVDLVGTTGVILPTYTPDSKGSAADMFMTLECDAYINALTLAATLTYTWINDHDSDVQKFQNTMAFSLAAGYLWTPTLSTLLSYSYSDAIYTDIPALQSGSLQLFYALSSDISLLTYYAMGLSASSSEHTLGLGVTYRF